MGTLRLKRGTNSQRTAYTPIEGELVYSTDTKEVFVGDGTTQGGVQVGGVGGSATLESLNNVQNISPTKDDLLVYNGSNWAATSNPALDVRGNIYSDDSTLLVDAINGQIVGPINTTSILSSGNIVGNLVGNVTGTVTGSLIGASQGAHTGTFDGDMTGSVFGDSSTVLVDGVNDSIFGKFKGEIDQTATGTFKGTINTTTTLNSTADINTTGNVTGVNLSATANITGTGQTISKADAFAATVYKRTSASTISDTTQLAKISVAYDEGAGNKSIWSIDTTKQYQIFFPDPTAGASADNTKFVQIWNNGKLQVCGEAGGTGYDGWVREPAATLEVYGNIKISDAKELLLGNMTTTQRNALTPANGMIIYNTTDNKFQGYEAGAWANLI